MHSSMTFAIFIHPYMENLNQNIEHNHHHPQKVPSFPFPVNYHHDHHYLRGINFLIFIATEYFCLSWISYK